MSRPRKPCALCGGSRDCDRPADDLRRKVDGRRVPICLDCLEQREERALARNQPDVRVDPDSELGRQLATVDEEAPERPGGIAWR